MNIRPRAAGLLAAAALSLSLIAGTGAQQVGTSITLTEGEGCSATLSQATITLGTWAWDGSTGTYKKPAEAIGGNFTVTAVNEAFGAERIACDVQLSAGPMTNEENAEQQIPNAITLTEASNSGNPLNLRLSTGTPKGISATLNPSFEQAMSAYGPGTYTGTITVTGASSSEPST